MIVIIRCRLFHKYFICQGKNVWKLLIKLSVNWVFASSRAVQKFFSVRDFYQNVYFLTENARFKRRVIVCLSWILTSAYQCHLITLATSASCTFSDVKETHLDTTLFHKIKKPVAITVISGNSSRLFFFGFFFFPIYYLLPPGK